MAQFQITSRNADGTSYYSELGMGNWLAGPIVEMVSRGFNGSFVEPDYISVQMAAVPGFPQLFFRLYGNFSFVTDVTSNGLGTYVAAGSIINTIEVIDASGFVYSRLSGINFAFNDEKTTVGIEPINVFATAFNFGETPDMALLMAGNDYLTGNSGGEMLVGFAGDDSLYGLAGVDALYGGFGADSLYGGADPDDLYGEAGNDIIFGYTAGDYIDGGADFDTWALTGLYSSGFGLPVRQDYTNVSFYNIEAIRVTWGEIVLNSNQVGGTSTVRTIIAGSVDRDALRVEMAAGAHVMDLSQVNFIGWNNYSGAFDWVTLMGTDSADTITGSMVADVIWAGEGANVARGGAGDDRINGGGGAENLRGGDGSDTLVGWGGNDTLIGDDTYTQSPGSIPGSDSIYGGFGNDLLIGGQGFNVLDGGDGIDTVDYGFVMQNPADATQYPIRGYIDLSRAVDPNDPNSAFSAYYDLDMTEVFIPALRDILVGIENVNGSNYAETIIGNALGNRLNGRNGADSISGLDGNDSIDGGNDNDTLRGGSGNDVLTGSAGRDSVDGGLGNDVINGGLGLDVLIGGAGADRFVFDTALAGNWDRIVGYSVVDDTIALNHLIFTGLAVGHLDSRAFKNLGLAAEDSDDHILWDPTTGILSFDVDGAGGAAAVRFAVVPSAVALTSLEFIVT